MTCLCGYFSFIIRKSTIKFYLKNLGSGGAFKTDIAPPTKRLSQNGITLKEYLDQEEEPESLDMPIEYSDLTQELFKQAYLDFYYWVRSNLEKVEEFLRLIREVEEKT